MHSSQRLSCTLAPLLAMGFSGGGFGGEERTDALSVSGGNILTEMGPTPAGTERRLLFPQWFAVYTTPRHEKRVREHFELRQIESFLPLYSSPRRWSNGCKVTVEEPLFPAYVFVRMDVQARVRVLEVPGVLSLVGTARQPSPLPEFEIESLRAALYQRRFEPHPYLTVGDRVRIKAGALSGMEGVLLRKKNSFRVVLGLELIMKSVAVEVDVEEVEPCAPRFPRVS